LCRHKKLQKFPGYPRHMEEVQALPQHKCRNSTATYLFTLLDNVEWPPHYLRGRAKNIFLIQPYSGRPMEGNIRQYIYRLKGLYQTAVNTKNKLIIFNDLSKLGEYLGIKVKKTEVPSIENNYQGDLELAIKRYNYYRELFSKI